MTFVSCFLPVSAAMTWEHLFLTFPDVNVFSESSPFVPSSTSLTPRPDPDALPAPSLGCEAFLSSGRSVHPDTPLTSSSSCEHFAALVVLTQSRHLSDALQSSPRHLAKRRRLSDARGG